VTGDEGTQQWKEFIELWTALLPNDRTCVVNTLIALQPHVDAAYINVSVAKGEFTIHHAEIVNRR